MNPSLKTPEKVLASLSLFIVLSSGAIAVAVENKVQEVVATEQVATVKTVPTALLSVEPKTASLVVKPKKEVKPLSYFENKTSLTDIELVWLLEAVGFEGQELKEAWAISKKESNGRPLAFNGNKLTGDNSYGIFQINMINRLGEDRREKFDLDHNADLFNPVKNAEIAFHMSQGGEVWRAWHIGKDAYTSTSGSHYAKFKEWLSKFPTEKK
jgi:hypothetical protein